jgi:hypothetical protein
MGIETFGARGGGQGTMGAGWWWGQQWWRCRVTGGQGRRTELEERRKKAISTRKRELDDTPGRTFPLPRLKIYTTPIHSSPCLQFKPLLSFCHLLHAIYAYWHIATGAGQSPKGARPASRELNCPQAPWRVSSSPSCSSLSSSPLPQRSGGQSSRRLSSSVLARRLTRYICMASSYLGIHQSSLH